MVETFDCSCIEKPTYSMAIHKKYIKIILVSKRIILIKLLLKVGTS